MKAYRFIFTLAIFGCIFTPSQSFAIDIANEETIEEQESLSQQYAEGRRQTVHEGIKKSVNSTPTINDSDEENESFQGDIEIKTPEISCEQEESYLSNEYCTSTAKLIYQPNKEKKLVYQCDKYKNELTNQHKNSIISDIVDSYSRCVAGGLKKSDIQLGGKGTCSKDEKWDTTKQKCVEAEKNCNIHVLAYNTNGSRNNNTKITACYKTPANNKERCINDTNPGYISLGVMLLSDANRGTVTIKATGGYSPLVDLALKCNGEYELRMPEKESCKINVKFYSADGKQETSSETINVKTEYQTDKSTGATKNSAVSKNKATIELTASGRTSVTVSANGYVSDTQTINCKGNDTFDLYKKVNCELNSKDKPEGATELTTINNKCVPTKCYEPRYKLKGRGENAKCEKQECKFKNGTGSWKGEKCTLIECNIGYEANSDNTSCIELTCPCGEEIRDNKCQPIEEIYCTANSIPALPENAATATKECNDKNKTYCKIESCKKHYKLDTKNNKCVKIAGTDCKSDDTNAKKSEYQIKDDNQVCIITKCNKGYVPSEDGTKCEKSDGECTKEQLEKIEHATAGERKKAECKATECESGFKVKKGKCVEEKSDEDKSSGNATSTESETEPEETKSESELEEEKTTDSGLNEEESQAKIDELQAESDAAHEKENSTANKLLGAAGIGATGIGAMQMMSGMAEQNADEDAENQMKAYLATFRCNYGGLSHKGGEMAIELPGSGDLLPLYTEYVNLANDLKIRKAALDMRPGIEAEAILDGATSGLYDDVHTGKTTGMYTSLARALSDPNGEDAKKWQEQKDAAAKKKKTGMITAAVGAAGSLVGNLIVNRDKKDKKTNDESLNKLHDDIGTLPTQTANCPSNTTGTYPDCQCENTNSIFNPNTLKCDPCKGDKVAIDGTCQCPTGTIVRENDKCETPTNGEDTNTCTLSGDNVAYKKDSKNCECINGFVQEGNQCVCKAPKQINGNGICITVSTNTTVTTKTEIITLSNDQLFAIGSYTLVDGAKNALESFLTDLSKNGKTNCKIDIEGYADPVGSENGNLTLSKNRANAIKDYLEKNNSNNVIKTITAVGMGENYCTCGVGTLPISDDLKDKPDYKNCVGKDASYQISGNQRYAPCRRVEISADCEQTETTIESATDIDIQSIASGIIQGKTGANANATE